MNISIFHAETYNPLESFGIVHTFLEFNTETVIFTWIAMAILIFIAFLGKCALKNPDSLGGYFTLKIIRSFYDMIEQATNSFTERHLFFIGTLFSFIFICNVLVLIPGFEEPTKDLNTAFALGIITLVYIQKEAIKAHGLLSYILHFFIMPFTIRSSKPLTFFTLLQSLLLALGNIVIGLFSFPLELVGKLTNALSLSLRLFGNIFGSSIICTLFKQATTGTQLVALTSFFAKINLGLALIITPIIAAFILSIYLCITLFFGLFEAFIQAFVFSVLSITHIALNTQIHDHTSKSESNS